MSEQYEPSYYEIALTGRQVLVAFVILMVCLVAAFFSGVWVGREEARKDQAPQVAEVEEPGGPTEAAPEGAVSEQPVAAEPEEGAGEAAPDALSFFGDEDEEPGGRTEPERPPERPQADRGTPARPAPAATDSADSKGAPGTSSEASPPTPSASPTGGLAGGDVVIQVFSSPDRAKAQEILEQLKANDFRAFISPLVDGGETYYRVRVGPFEYESDARRVAEELRRKLDLETWITR